MAELLTAGGLIITVLLVYMQIQKQHEAGILLQREHLRDELRAKLYEGLSASVQNASRLIGRANTMSISIVSSLHSRMDHPSWPLSATSEEMSEMHFSGAQALSDVLVEMEQYEIVFMRFRTIRRTLAEEHGRVLMTYTPLAFKFGSYLTHRTSDGGATLDPLATPTSEELTDLEELRRTYGDACGGVSAFLADLQVEMQNELLSHLFDGRIVPPRNPEDSNLVVLQRDPEDPVVERPKGRWV